MHGHGMKDDYEHRCPRSVSTHISGDFFHEPRSCVHLFRSEGTDDAAGRRARVV